MRKPQVSKPRSATTAFSLSRKMPRLALPPSAAAATPSQPKPRVGKPGRSMFLDAARDSVKKPGR